MAHSGLTTIFRRRLSAGTPLLPDVGNRVIVFAPHPDDETLGCGGTIARKCAAGEDVTVVAMTDGAGSHAHLMPVEQLIEVRKSELLRATSILGVSAEKVLTLGFSDGDLVNHVHAARQQVAELMEQVQPTEVYIPARWDTPKDHFATYSIVKQVLAFRQGGVRVYEYPVWFWMQWPFAMAELRGRSELPAWFLRNTLSNYRLLRHFSICSDIQATVQKKRDALAQYVSQMTRLVETERWCTLHDVDGGNFLGCFYQSFEVFYRSQ